MTQEMVRRLVESFALEQPTSKFDIQWHVRAMGHPMEFCWTRLNVVSQHIQQKAATHQHADMAAYLSQVYLAAAAQDLGSFIDFNLEYFGLPTAALQQMRHLADDSSLKFDAYAESISDGTHEVGISLGTLLALDDVYFRAACNAGFLSSEQGERQGTFVPKWRGCSCVYPPRSNQTPRLRFVDYEAVTDNRGINFWPSRFFSGYPLDIERHLVARNLVWLTLSWIQFHEESHVWNGHLAFLKGKGLGLRLNESSENPVALDSSIPTKLMELQADLSSSRGIVDCAHYQPDLFPKPPGLEDKDFRIRMCLVAAGVATLLFERARRQNDLNCISHPSAAARLVNGMKGVIERAIEKAEIELDLDDIAQRLIRPALEDVQAVAELLDDLSTHSSRLSSGLPGPMSLSDGFGSYLPLTDIPLMHLVYGIGGNSMIVRMFNKRLKAARPNEALNKADLDSFIGYWLSESEELRSLNVKSGWAQLRQYRNAVGNFNP